MKVLPFTRRARKILDDTLNEVSALQSEYVGAEHLFLALSASGSRYAATNHADLVSTCAVIHRILSDKMRPGTGDGSRSVPQTPAAKQSIILAMRHADSLGHSAVNPEHLFLALLDLHSEPLVELVTTNENIDIAELRKQLIAASQFDRSTGPAPEPC